MSQDDAYAYTHALMYLTDFGARPPGPSLTLSRMTQVLNACLAWTLLDEDYDLLAEFLLGYALLRQRWTPHVMPVPERPGGERSPWGGWSSAVVA